MIKTITFKIDKRTKAGKAFIGFTEAFLQNVEGIEIIEKDAKKTKKSKSFIE